MEQNKNFLDTINNPFYNYGGINVDFDLVKDFLNTIIFMNEIKISNINETYENNKEIENLNNKEKLGIYKNKDNIQLTFEYIDCLEKLELPVLYQSIINVNKIDKIENYNEYLYSKYSNQNNLLNLLYDIKTISNIPIELLCKYYIRLYTMESNFYKYINTDLRNRGSFISEGEINIIKDYLKNKKSNLPGAIVFSKSFLSFTKDINIAKSFLTNVLYILIKDNDIDYSLSTHCDVENISYSKNEKEVLFFPFSSFEIKEIKETNKDNKIIFQIKLIYLGKYLKEIENDKNITEKENIIPDSEFKKQIVDFGLIQPENFQNTKQLFEHFIDYKNDVNKNYITGIIKIGEKNINKEIRIIGGQVDDIEIKINRKKVQCIKKIERFGPNQSQDTYHYKFSSEGEYFIEYSFKKYLTNMSHMFNSCDTILSLDLSNFYSKNVIYMECTFAWCNSLISIDLSNFNTENVIRMYGTFLSCRSLKSLDLSNFNTQKVETLNSMFARCESLISLDLSNFHTENLKYMPAMFEGCKSLKSLDLSNFNTENVKTMYGMFSGCPIKKNEVRTFDKKILEQLKNN